MNERDELVNDIREWANTTGGPSPDAPQIDVLALVIRDAGLDMTRLDDDRKAFVRAYRRGADEPELDDLAYELRVYGDKLIDQVLNASTAQVHKYYAHRKLVHGFVSESRSAPTRRGRFKGIGRVAGYHLAYVTWDDTGKTDEFSLSGFRKKFGVSAMRLETGSPVEAEHESRSSAVAKYRLRTVDGEIVTVSSNEFFNDNQDMDPDDQAEIRRLKKGETFHGGGGAAPEWSITRI